MFFYTNWSILTSFSLYLAAEMAAASLLKEKYENKAKGFLLDVYFTWKNMLLSLIELLRIEDFPMNHALQLNIWMLFPTNIAFMSNMMFVNMACSLLVSKWTMLIQILGQEWQHGCILHCTVAIILFTLKNNESGLICRFLKSKHHVATWKYDATAHK